MPALTRRRDPDANQETWLMTSVSAASPCAPACRPTRTSGAGVSGSIRRQIAACARARPPSHSTQPAPPSTWRGSGCSPSSRRPISQHTGATAHSINGSTPCGMRASSCRRRSRMAGRPASVARRSELRMWRVTSTPRTRRAHEIHRAPPLRRSRCIRRAEADRDEDLTLLRLYGPVRVEVVLRIIPGVVQISHVRGVVAATDTAYRRRRRRSRRHGGMCIHRMAMMGPMRGQSRRSGNSKDSKTN